MRPTGLIDPKVTVKPLKGQIDDLIEEVRKRGDAKERMLVTTLTKRTAEELTDYLRDIGVNVRYLHSEIDAIERVEILRALRKGEFDVLVGINLLREGSGFAGSFAGGDSGRGQGGFSAQRNQPDPDRRPRRAPSERRGDSLRRRDDAEHPEISGRHRIPPPAADSPTTASTTSRRAASAARSRKACRRIRERARRPTS